jgi:hypothetical protein
VRFHPARIHLLDGSLYTWLGAKALSQFSLMGGNPRGILYNRKPDVPFTVDSGQGHKSRQISGSKSRGHVLQCNITMSVVLFS